VASGDPHSPRQIPYAVADHSFPATAKLFLANGDVVRDAETGYLRRGIVGERLVVRIKGLLDASRQPLKGFGPVEFCIRPAAAVADAKHMPVIDFSNSAPAAGVGDDQRDHADAA
jgi:hypothetical protein